MKDDKGVDKEHSLHKNNIAEVDADQHRLNIIHSLINFGLLS